MIYFLSVLYPLFLLFTVSSSKSCRDQISVSGGTKPASETGFHYGLLFTPNFPEPFNTPFKQTWVIDASHHKNDTQINLYLTQMYLSKGVRLFQRAIPSCEHLRKRQIETGGRQECRKSGDQHFPEIHVDKLYELLRVSTSCPYLEVEVDVPSLYGWHYRTRDPFLFHVYGFNITYEIVPEAVGLRNDSCYPRNCSNLGHCYLRENWRDFFCDCVKDHPGPYCNTSPFCDPENNITFCENGGKCKILGSGDGYCECEAGFTGVRCESRLEQPKVSARTGCSNAKDCPVKENIASCEPDVNWGPCSCPPKPKNGKKVPDDWVKYEGRLEISSSYKVLLNQTTIGYEIQSSIADWFKTNDVSNNSVFVRFYSPLGDSPPANPEKLLINFHGPLGLRDSFRGGLLRWLDRSATNRFYRQIQFLKGTFELHTMPRVQFKSLEVSKGERLKIDKPVSLTCTATTGSSPHFSNNDIRFRWFKDGVPVNKSISTRGIHFFRRVNGNDTMSVMLIDLVSAFDGGRYTCEISDMEFGDQQCGHLVVEISLPPQIEVEPLGLTLEKKKLNQSEVIICTDGSYSSYNPHNKSTVLDWFRGSTKERVVNNDVVVVEDIIPQGKLLRILRAEHSESFTCSGFNKEGGERFKVVKVNVLDSKHAPSCNRQYERLAKSKVPLWWEWTALGSVAMKMCPEGFHGIVQRPCVRTYSGKVQWGRSDFSRCISDTLRHVNKTLQHAKRGFGDWKNSSAVRLMGEMRKYVNSTNKVLYSGEGEKIVDMMADIVKYASWNGKVNYVFDNFFRTVVQFLRIRNSCVHEETVHTLCKLVAEMGVPRAMQAAKQSSSNSPQVNASDVLMLQVLPISADADYKHVSYVFPVKEEITKPNLSWLKNKVHIDFPLDSAGFRKDANSPLMYYLIMAAYKNLSSLLAPNDIFPQSSGGISRSRVKSSLTSIELISPVVQISMHDSYYLPPESYIKIHFNLSREHLSLLGDANLDEVGAEGGSSTDGNDMANSPAKGTRFSCGVLDNSSFSTKTTYGGLRWKLDACGMKVFRLGSYAECQCGTTGSLGVFGLLKVSQVEDTMNPQMTVDIPRIIIIGFSFCILSCVLSSTVLCIYLRCRISLNSLYALKLLDCIFIFSAVFIVMLGVDRTEIPSASWLAWSASACSFFISSLSVQVTKALRILLLETKPELPRFIFPWLSNVSQLTVLSAIIFSTVLPIWTATVAKMVRFNASNESAFEESSQVFAVFIGTVGLVGLAFLAIYYKAYLKTRGELEECRQQNHPISVSDMLNYKMKTLNRSLCLTLVLLVMILGIVLYENLRHSIYIQYFLGLSAIAMGIALVFCYVSHSEYPIFATLCSSRGSQPEKPLYRDPEKTTPASLSNGGQRKLYHISSGEVSGNGSLRGTGRLLLPPPPPQMNRNGRHFGEEAESFSVEEQSMDTFSTEVSYRVPVPAHPPSAVQKIPIQGNRRKSVRSTGSNTVSSSASSFRSQMNPSMGSDRVLPEMDRVSCGLTISTGDYIFPSNQNHRPRNEGMIIARPESSAASTTNCNYIPITDNHNNADIRKINDNLSKIFD